MLTKCGHSSVVERLVANEKVEGSTPFARSIKFKNIVLKKTLIILIIDFQKLEKLKKFFIEMFFQYFFMRVLYVIRLIECFVKKIYQ